MEVRRGIDKIEELQCTFVSEDGQRCQEKGWLELDHLEGFARTHQHSARTTALRCRAHNQFAAEQMYGRDFMAKARKKAPRPDARNEVIRFETDNLRAHATSGAVDGLNLLQPGLVVDADSVRRGNDH